MKPTTAVGLAAVAVIATVAIQETRISALRRELAAVRDTDSPIAEVNRSDASAPLHPSSTRPPTTAKSSIRPSNLDKTERANEPEIASAVRKMWENPAGKAMMSQGIKIAVAMQYETLIDRLDLSDEEATYFKDLLSKGLADQQEISMKLISADPAQQTEIINDLEQRKQENQEDIKTFLNNDEDFQRFTEYQERLPERQQLDGIRATFAAADVGLEPEIEERLIEAMYQSRTQAGGIDSNSPEAFAKLRDGSLAASFESNWDSEGQALLTEAGAFLSPAQLKALQDYRHQMKELQMTNLKMAETIFKDGGE